MKTVYRSRIDWWIWATACFFFVVLIVAAIKAIKSCKSFLWGPALSSDKLAITFTDRSVLKLSGPMYISPKDKERFVGQLLEINPDIKINL